MQSESIANIVAALTNAALEMTNVEKNMNVGAGRSTYKGVADKDVKIVTRVMLQHGLIVTPLSYEPTTTLDTWEEEDSYNKGVMKRKKEMFVELQATYRVAHTSGEFMDIAGYGHGVDSQDKGAGKATTYALKYALIYLFNLIIGDVDDTDLTHSNDIPAKPTYNPKPKVETKPTPPTPKPKPKAEPKKLAKGVKPEPAPLPETQEVDAVSDGGVDTNSLEDVLYTMTDKQAIMKWFQGLLQDPDVDRTSLMTVFRPKMLEYIKSL